MAKKFTEEQLNNLDKDMLITLFLGLQDQMEQMSRNLTLLTEQIAVMNQRSFGRSSEKDILPNAGYDQARMIEFNGEMVVVFNETESHFSDTFTEPDQNEIFPEKKRTGRPKGKREQDLADVFGDKGYKQLPDEVYKRLVYRPATQIVEEHHVAVYAGTDNETIVKADRSKDLLRGSIVTPSLQAAILNGKYVNAIPLYRLEQDFARNGANISRQTMANWTIRTTEKYLSLLYDRMHEQLYKSHVLQADETPVLVNKDGRKAGSKSYMWVYRTGERSLEPPVILYEYQKTRKSEHPARFLKDFKGVVVTDGYEVYHKLEREKEYLYVAGCWSHARRRFAEIVKASKKSNLRGSSLAATVLKKIQDIYHLEDGLKELSPEERLKRRQDSIRPLVDAFFAWLKEHKGDVPPQSATGKGISYCLKQEPYLRYFLKDGEVPLDNNAAERAIRGFCIGKKNWVMIDTVNGAKASAIIYSIAETAKANHIRTYHYFEHLLTEIPKHMDDKDLDFIEDLLPWSPNLPDSCRFIK